MSDRPDRSDGDPAAAELAARRRAAADDFLQSHAVGEIIAHIGDDARDVRDALIRRGVDRAAAWEAALGAVRASDQAAPTELAAQFEAAAQRWDDGADVEDIDPERSTAAASNALQAAFPGTQFAVTSRADAWGRWLLLEWTDGPTEQQATDVAQQFVGVHGDAGHLVRHVFYGVSTWRNYSPGAIAWAERALAAAGIRRDDTDPDEVDGIPDDATDVTVDGEVLDVSMDVSLERLVKKLLDAREL